MYIYTSTKLYMFFHISSLQSMDTSRSLDNPIKNSDFFAKHDHLRHSTWLSPKMDGKKPHLMHWWIRMWGITLITSPIFRPKLYPKLSCRVDIYVTYHCSLSIFINNTNIIIITIIIYHYLRWSALYPVCLYYYIYIYVHMYIYIPSGKQTVRYWTWP